MIENDVTRETAYTMISCMDLDAAKNNKQTFIANPELDLTFERTSESENSPVAPEFQFYTLTPEQFIIAIDAVIADLS